jgi:hypothetical protein
MLQLGLKKSAGKKAFHHRERADILLQSVFIKPGFNGSTATQQKDFWLFKNFLFKLGSRKKSKGLVLLIISHFCRLHAFLSPKK